MSLRLPLLLISLLFAAAYTQAALFTSNQNTYFLHGLAMAGEGELARDWMAQTTSSVPVFSLYVALVAGVPAVFFLVHGLIVALYAGCLLWLVQRTFGGDRVTLTVTGLALALVHAPPVAVLKAGGPTLSRVLTAATEGLAGQPLLRPFHQPSVFGVGLLLAAVLGLAERRMAAVVVAALVPWMHGAYFLPAALLTLWLLVDVRSEPKRAGSLALVSVALVAVPLWGAVSTFGASSPELAAEAARILGHERFPHHADPQTWVDAWAGFQALWVALGLAVSLQNRRLFGLLALWAGAGVVLTGGVWATGSDRLALVLPWRLFVLLVPTSTALVLGFVVHHGMSRVSAGRRAIEVVAGLGLAGLAVVGLVGTGAAMGASRGTSKLTRGMKAACGQSEVVLIPPEESSWRLATRCPVFVDWKSHPYKDVEVLEWKARLELANRFYGAKRPAGRKAALAAVRAHSDVTHVLMPRKGSRSLGEVVVEAGDNVVVALPR